MFSRASALFLNTGSAQGNSYKAYDYALLMGYCLRRPLTASLEHNYAARMRKSDNVQPKHFLASKETK